MILTVDVTLYGSVNYPANINMFSIISNDPQGKDNLSSSIIFHVSVEHLCFYSFLQ